MGLVHAYKKGEVPASKVSKAVKDAAKSMSGKSVKKYAKTKHDDLPKKVSEKYNYKKAREKFKKTGELPDHLKKLVKDLDKLYKFLRKKKIRQRARNSFYLEESKNI